MSRRKGFTLVELVVVVLILGILAAVAAPKIITNSSEAEESSISQTLASIRDALELYNAQKASGGYPQGTSDDIHTKLDDYLRGASFPKASGAVNSNAVLIDADDVPTVVTSGGQGWVYSPSSGEIKINSDALMVDGTTKFSDL